MRITGGVAGPDGTANAQQLFKQIDTDGDGKVTKDEFAAGAPKRGGGKGPSVDDLFSRIDANSDGSIDKAENSSFLESVKSRRPGPPDPTAMARKLFEKADGDHDGKITQDELEAALPRHDSSEALNQLFAQTDADQDGAVSQDELAASLKAHFDQRATTYTADGGNHSPAGPVFSRIA